MRSAMTARAAPVVGEVPQPFIGWLMLVEVREGLAISSTPRFSNRAAVDTEHSDLSELTGLKTLITSFAGLIAADAVSNGAQN